MLTHPKVLCKDAQSFMIKLKQKIFTSSFSNSSESKPVNHPGTMFPRL